jgi:hypothetical protein
MRSVQGLTHIANGSLDMDRKETGKSARVPETIPTCCRARIGGSDFAFNCLELFAEGRLDLPAG